MAALVRISVADPQNVLDTYGSGAVARLERSTSSTMSGASEITTIAVVAATREYEYRDTAGTPGTDYYWYRFSKASPSVADDYSGYSAIVLAGALAGEVITLERAKDYLGIEDTVDDAWLPVTVNAINRSIIRDVGIDLGPAPDTVRTYDARDAVDGWTVLYIPGGIRTFTAVEVSEDGSTWTAVTSDVRIGPLVFQRTPGEPGAYIEFAPYVTGGVSSFWGYRYVRITGTAFATFGWDAWPADVEQVALVALQRAAAERAMGGGGLPTESTVSRYIKWDASVLWHYRHLYRAMAA